MNIENQSSALPLVVTALCQSNPLLARLMSKAGTFAGVRWTSEVATLAAHRGVTVTKTVQGVFAVGRAYDARQVVKDARESGELPAVNAGLKWGQWLAFPYLIEHKGCHYVRLYPVQGAKVRASFYRDGLPITREEAVSLCGSRAEASELADYACLSPKLANLTRVV